MIPEGGLYSDDTPPLGTIAGHFPGERIVTRVAEGQIPFGAGVVRGEPGAVKVPDGAPLVFEGVALQSTEAESLDESAYEEQDVVGVIEAGEVVVQVEEAIDENDPVRLRHTDDKTSGSQSWGFSEAKTAASATGLVNDATAYTAVVVVDGVNVPVSVVGSAAQTIATLINEINTDLDGDAVAEFVATGNGFIKITSATKGSDSSILITDTDLFDSLTNANEAPEAAIPGVDSVDPLKFPGSFCKTAIPGETALLTNVRWGSKTTGPGPAKLILYGNSAATADTE